MENKKTSLSVQVNDELYNALKNLCSEYGVTIATLIRMILVDYMKRYKNYLLNQSEKGSLNDND